jgi:hypothetical protein
MVIKLNVGCLNDTHIRRLHLKKIHLFAQFFLSILIVKYLIFSTFEREMTENREIFIKIS